MLSLVYHNFLEKNISAFNAVKEGATQGEKYCKSLIGYFNAHGNGTTQDFLKDISFFKKENKQNMKKLLFVVQKNNFFNTIFLLKIINFE